MIYSYNPDGQTDPGYAVWQAITVQEDADRYSLAEPQALRQPTVIEQAYRLGRAALWGVILFTLAGGIWLSLVQPR